jgi:serine/threonine protein kinase/lipoprotein NlpI
MSASDPPGPPGRDPDSTRTEPESPAHGPQRVGPYTLVERIGEGGFGVVYLAAQEAPVRRRVALKVIKPGMDTEQVLARFDAERQALAQMNHPNVARIHDAGCTSEGRPYFAMEYVAGVPITEHCDAHRLGLRRRLDLFEQVCRGVHHAHQKGIIHRDLKPGNILVQYEDGEARPKIIDFGVAKALHAPAAGAWPLTERGQRIGTPAYMSPEQADPRGQDIDVRTDIYALGVVLYELLTGVRPFDDATLQRAGQEGMLRLIRETDPPRPSTRILTLGAASPERSSEAARRRGVDPRTLARRLRDDLDWIAMMCLEKDRSRRYDSAAALAEDLRSHLAQRPVRARAPSVTYRAAKFWRRHRAGVVGAAVLAGVVLAAVASVTAITVSRLRIEQQRDELLAAALVEQARLIGYRHAAEARRMLERALRLAPGSSAARLERARLRLRQGRPHEAIAEARELLRRDPGCGGAAALLAGLLARSDPAESQRWIRQAGQSLDASALHAALAFAEPDAAEAIRLFSMSLEQNPWNFDALWQRGVRRFELRDLEGALADAELMVRVRSDLALAWTLHGAVLRERGELEPALRSFDEALARDALHWLAHYDRGIVLAQQGRHAQALESIDRALALQPDDADALTERGRNLEALRRRDEAVEAHQRALAIGGDDWHRRWDLAGARLGAWDFAGAERDYSAALSNLPAGAEREPQRAALLTGRAEARMALGRLEAAGQDLDRASSIRADDAKVESLRARLARSEGRYDRALAHLDRAVRLAPENPYYPLERGVTLWQAGRIERAVPDLDAFAGSPDPDASWVRLWIWEIERDRADAPAAARQLAAARDGSPAPLLARLLDVLAGAAAPEAGLDLATSKEQRLHAYYTLGARALALSQPAAAREWFLRCTGLGLANELEHELAVWRLRGLGGATAEPASGP